MNSLNKVELIGNLTASPEIRETPNGTKVASISIATNRKWKDASGTVQEEVEYHRCVAWGNLAEIFEKYTGKGKKVYVEGRLKTSSWEDTEGKKHYKTEIVIERLILLSPKSASDGASSEDDVEEEETPKRAPAKKAGTAKKKGDEIHIEDIPF